MRSAVFARARASVAAACWCGDRRHSHRPALRTPHRRLTGGGSAEAGDGDRRSGRSPYTRGGAGDAESAYAQFQRQQSAFHRHSFHEKGSRAGRPEGGESKTEADDGRAGASDSGSAARASATARERRAMSSGWENAFFGRVHYEEGMHDRFKAVVDAEELEKVGRRANAELFPSWPEDEDAPAHLFVKLPPAQQLRYILNRLEMAERRIRYAPDYGSLLMMAQLNLGVTMLAESERLLVELGWMNEAMQEKIEELREVVRKVNYDYDLD